MAVLLLATRAATELMNLYQVSHFSVARLLPYLRLIGLLAAFGAVNVTGQDAAPSQPPEGGLRIQFVPPPMKGTISLGIYDGKGKLVRVLKREAPPEAFIIALNGLVTFWDGKDDRGGEVPADTYFARGFMVGTFEIEGEAYHGNDWVVDATGPRIARIEAIRMDGSRLALLTLLGDGNRTPLEWDETGGRLVPAGSWNSRPTPHALIDGGTVVIAAAAGKTLLSLPGVHVPLAAALGRDDSIWLIDQSEGVEVVKQYSARGELLRSLPVDRSSPRPKDIAASRTADEIYLLEVGEAMQRVRGLRLKEQAQTEGGGAVSTWEEFLNKGIWRSDTLEIARARLKDLGRALNPQEKLTIALRPNPLEQGKPGKAEVSIQIDQEGSLLKLSDGLPLVHLTETPGLKWAVTSRNSDSRELTVFQSDGAVIEEFKVTRLANMVAFDCGEIELPRSLAK
jgi:hypothetical protein